MAGYRNGRIGRALLSGTILSALALGGAPVTGVVASSCAPTDALDRDGTALTARLVNPQGTVGGHVDARGCDVGVYFSRGHGRVRSAEVSGARYYGVLVDGNDGHVVQVDVTDSAFHDIGDDPITASRHGQGVAYRAFGTGSATGTVTSSRFWDFQEAGINMTGPGTTVKATGNRVEGRGPIDTLSQNGIQVIFGAHGSVLHNRISNLSFLGANTSNGVLVAGGAAYDGNPALGCLPSGCSVTRKARIEGNVISNADIGVAVFNADADGNPPAARTSTVVTGNLIRKDSLTNIAGWDGSIGAQEGIFVYGNRDSVIDNVIVGQGYDQGFCGDAAICMAIDTTGAVDPIVKGNVIR